MTKSTIIAVIVFAALAVAAFATLREKPERGITRVSFAKADPAKIDKIVVQGAQPIELVRDGDTWKTGSQRADKAAVERALDAVQRVDSSDVVTRNADRFTELEVDAEKGTAVQAYAGGAKVADFVVGSSTATGANVRVDDTVYLVKRIAKGAFARERTQWIDRKLFADGPDDVNRIDVKLAGHAPYALLKDNDVWKPENVTTLPAEFRFDANAARSLVSALVAAQAQDVLEQDAGDVAAGLAEGADTLTFHAAAGEPRTLKLGGKKDEGSVYARASTRTELVTVPEHLAKSLRKPITALRDMTFMSLDTSAAKRLEIVNDKDRLVLEKDGDAWKVAQSTKEAPKDFEFDPMMVTRRLGAIGSARAVAPAPLEEAAPAKTGLDKPARSASVTLDDGRIVTLAFGKETKHDDADAVYARGNADDEIYLVNAFTRNAVLGGIETFAKRDESSPLANLDPKALENLPPEVRDSLMKQIQQKRAQDEMMRKVMEKAAKEGAAHP
jgi:hypothetical protein